MKRILVVVFMFLMISDAQATSEFEKESLRGLPSFFVLIEDVSRDSVVTKQTLRTDVELRLRDAGISIFDQNRHPRSAPSLHVRLAQKENAFYLGLSLAQSVSLLRSPTVVVPVTTWEVGMVGVNPTAPYIRQKVKDLTDMFINDYLSVNPKR